MTCIFISKMARNWMLKKTKTNDSNSTSAGRDGPASIKTIPVQHSASSRVHPLNDQVVKYHLLLCSLHNVLFNAALGHQPIHTHLHSASR